MMLLCIWVQARWHLVAALVSRVSHVVGCVPMIPLLVCVIGYEFL
jgi:hypothetical protein